MVKFYLSEIYNKEKFLKKNLENWFQENFEFSEKYDFENLYKNKENFKIIKMKEKEIKWILENYNKEKSKLNNINFLKSSYTKRQKELYSKIQQLFNNKENLKENEWKNLDYKIKTDKREYNCEIEYRKRKNILQLYFSCICPMSSIFIALINKLKKNNENEILSHFYIEKYSGNQVSECISIEKIKLNKHLLNNIIIVIV